MVFIICEYSACSHGIGNLEVTKLLEEAAYLISPHKTRCLCELCLYVLVMNLGKN